MENKKSQKILTHILVVFSISVFVGLILNCYPTFFWSDDFIFSHLLSKKSVGEFVMHMYNGWDGRHLTLGGLAQAFFIKYTNSVVTTMVWCVCYISSFYWVSKTFLKDKHFIVTALLSSVFLIIFQSHLFQTLYWSVGGLYSILLMMGALWLFVYHQDHPNVFLLGVISLFAGASTQNLSVCIMAIVFFDICSNYLKTKSFQKIDFIVLGLLTIGTLHISLAPGNRLRTGSLHEDWTIVSRILMMMDVYLRAILLTKPIYFIAPVLALITQNLKKNHENDLSNGFKYLFAAIASLLPFVLLPPMMSAEARTTIYFQFFVFISVLNFSWYILAYMQKSYFFSVAFSKWRNLISYFIAQSVFIVTLVLLVFNFKNGMKLKDQFIERETVIKNADTKNIVVPPIQLTGSRANFMHYFFDISTDSTHSFNILASKYYNIESIKATKKQIFQ